VKNQIQIILLLIGLGLFSCNNQIDQATSNQSLDEAKQLVISTAKVDIKEPIKYIKDSSDYSTEFLENLYKSGVINVQLIGNMFIGQHNDTSFFPKQPEIGNNILFTGRKDELIISLRVKRINQTTIDYNLEIIESGNSSLKSKGYADINSGFYIGPELDENEITGNAYFSTEFIDYNDTCYTYIRIGKDEQFQNKLFGKIIKNCNGKIKNIELDNFPVLVAKSKCAY
jgi:hypothetical protein